MSEVRKFLIIVYLLPVVRNLVKLDYVDFDEGYNDGQGHDDDHCNVNLSIIFNQISNTIHIQLQGFPKKTPDSQK